MFFLFRRTHGRRSTVRTGLNRRLAQAAFPLWQCPVAPLPHSGQRRTSTLVFQRVCLRLENGCFSLLGGFWNNCNLVPFRQKVVYIIHPLRTEGLFRAQKGSLYSLEAGWHNARLS